MIETLVGPTNPNSNNPNNTPNTISDTPIIPDNANPNININFNQNPTFNPNSTPHSNLHSNTNPNSSSNSISNSSSSSNPNSNFNSNPNSNPPPTSPPTTSTIDITHVSQILSACPNYDHIISAKYPEDDPLSSLLINWYRDLIFSASPSDPSQLKIIRALDKSLYYYVTSRKYHRLLQTNLTPAEITLQDPAQIKSAIKKIIHLTTTYESKMVLDIPTSKWL